MTTKDVIEKLQIRIISCNCSDEDKECLQCKYDKYIIDKILEKEFKLG